MRTGVGASLIRNRVGVGYPLRHDQPLRFAMTASARTYLLLGLGMAMFGSGTPISREVTGAFPVFFASFARMVLAAAVLIALMLLARRESTGWERVVPRIDRFDWARIVGIALAGMFLFSIFMLYGMKEVSGAIGGIVMATTPAVTAVGAILFLGDRLDRWTSIAVGAAVAGVLAVNLGGVEAGSSGNVLLGSLLVFGAVCGEASYTLLGKRVSADLEPITIAALAALLASMLFAPLAALQLGDVEWGAIAATDWAALGWWGLGTMAVGSVLWYSGVSRAPGTTASAFMGVMPVSALILSYLLLGEAFRWIHLVGMVAVLVGIAAVTQSGRATEEDRSPS